MSGSAEVTGAGRARSADIAMIWAQTESGVIGVDGDMPWHLPEDFAHFKSSTLGSPVIMGPNHVGITATKFAAFAGENKYRPHTQQ